VTVTVTVHDPLAGTTAPAKVNVAVAPTAVAVPLAQVVLAAGALAFTRPEGYASANAAPVIAAVFEFVSVMTSVEVPATIIDAASNDTATAGGPMIIVAALAQLKVAATTQVLPTLVGYCEELAAELSLA
jgi:hypothetical protein